MQLLESVPKELVVKIRGLLDESGKSAWAALECKHQIGLEIIEYKRKHTNKSTELLEEMAEAIGQQVNYKFLQLCERFARRFPDFRVFRQKYTDEILEPFSREPSFTYIVENFLYEKRIIDLHPDENVTIEEGEENGHHYRRAVINLIPFDQKFQFEDRYTKGAQKHKVLPSNYLRGCAYGIWDLSSDGLISEPELEQVRLELVGRKEQGFDF